MVSRSARQTPAQGRLPECRDRSSMFAMVHCRSTRSSTARHDLVPRHPPPRTRAAPPRLTGRLLQRSKRTAGNTGHRADEVIVMMKPWRTLSRLYTEQACAWDACSGSACRTRRRRGRPRPSAGGSGNWARGNNRAPAASHRQRARWNRAAGQAAGAGKVYAGGQSGAAGKDGAIGSVCAASQARTDNTDNIVVPAVEGHHG